MIQLDGSFGEGGGAIVRVALALSTITQKPFTVNNIRKGRCDSGLKNQHLYCVKALQQLCNADIEGANLGSEHLQYKPGKIEGKTLNIDIETAGSITLLLQALLLPCFFSDKKVVLKINGGTDVKWSMPFDYFNNILVPQLKKYAYLDVRLIKRGYYPKGNGLVEITINPKYKLTNSDFEEFNKYLRNEKKEINLLNQHNLIHIKGISHASSDLQKAEVAERQAKAAKIILANFKCNKDIRIEYCKTLSTGSGITLWAIFSEDTEEINLLNPIRIGSDSLGEKGKKAEIVGREAAERLINEINHKAPVDSYLSDNLIPWMALFGGKIKVAKLTNHTLTNIYVTEKFLGKIFNVNKKEKIISVKSN